MDDFSRQKAEAEQRVREMNRRYREKAGMPPAPPFVQVGHEKPAPPANPGGPFDLFRLLRLEGLSGDRDRLLILGLFLLLNSEGADEKLLYALLYILL